MSTDTGIAPITAPWPVADIVYVSIMGFVMMAAFLEWFLWLAAFLYCLVKVYIKADHWTIKILAIVMMIGFTLLRLIFLPIMIVTLPLPARVTQYYPKGMVSFLQWFAFWSFAVLLTVPWLFCIYQLVTNSLGRTKRIKTILDEDSAPKTVIVMPVYKEEPEVLVTAVDSVVDCDYPPSCLHVFLSFDGDQEDELYLKTIEKLGVPLTLEHYPKSIDIAYRMARVTVSRFPHGGKRQCQKNTFKLIDKIYTEYLKRNDNLFILFIDSDCILDKVCIQNFMYEMELRPGSKQNMLAMTGVITSTTEKHSLITLLQDMEYIHGQLFERAVESGCGSVTCLPGALTMLRFSAFRRMAKYYFADKAEQCDDLFDYGKCHLGEDRWLTHLFMIGARERYQIQMCTGAFCKTEAVQTYKSLLKQRRRWRTKTTALLFFIMVISIITTSNKVSNLPVGFIAVSLGLNWLLMIYFGAKLRRYKVWLYPVMFVINPFFNWVYMVYGIFTAGQRTWGGPRADAGAADTHTTPQQAIEHAIATGDDLNVVPETFKPAAEAIHPEKPINLVPVQPTENIEGRFAPAEELPGGWYLNKAADSGLTLPNMFPQVLDVPRVPLHPRDSWESLVTSASPTNSVYMPRRVESIMSEEDRRKYFFAQQAQAAPTGAYLNVDPPRGQVYEMSEEANGQELWSSSVESLGSGEDNPPHVQHHPRYARPASSSSVSPGSSPPFAPRRPSRLSSSLHCPDHAELGGQDFHLPPPQRSHSGPRRHSAEPSPLAQVPLIRLPTGEPVESFELQERARVREPLMGQQKAQAASTSQVQHQDGLAGEVVAEDEMEEKTNRKKKRKRLFKGRGKK